MRLSSLFAFLCLLATAGCAGYSPIYSPAGMAPQVQVGEVSVVNPALKAGERRTAQIVRQQLLQAFPGTQATDTLIVRIEEATDTLAIARNATVERSQVVLNATVVIEEADGTPKLTTTISERAAYNVQDTPYSTEAGRTYARVTAAEVLGEEIARRVASFYRFEERQDETPAQPSQN